MGKQNCNAKKDRQCNGQQKQEKTQQTMIRTWKQKKQKMIHRKLKDWATQTLLKNEYIFDKYIKISVCFTVWKEEYDDTDGDTDKEGDFGNASRPQSMKIDLTRVRSAYSARTHKESNLPSVLTDYGMEDEKPKVYKICRNLKWRTITL